MPKRIKWWEMYITAWFAMSFELLANCYIDLKYDLYGFFDKGPSWATLVLIFGLYPAGNAIILNFYPYHKPWVAKMLYVVIIDVLCIVFEQVSIWSGVMYYNGWTWWYSALSYLVIIPVLVWNRRIARNLINKGN